MERWSRDVHPREGALLRYGWRADESAELRHRALERSVHRDGYAKTIERLDFVANVAGRDNHRLKQSATEDRAWLEDQHEPEDSPRRRSTHEVREHRAERDGRGYRVRRHEARNPRGRA